MRKLFDKDGSVEFSGIGDAIKNVHGPYSELEKERQVVYLATTPTAWNNNHNVSTITALLSNPPEATIGSLDIAETIETESTAPARTARRMIRRLDDGDEFDTDALLRRESDMWQECRRVKADQKAVRVLINITAHKGIDASAAQNRAALMMAIISVCQKNSVAVEIDAVVAVAKLFPRARNERVHKLKVKLHEMGNAVDVNQISVAVGDMGFFRVIMIANAITCSNEINYEMCKGGGYPRDLDANEWQEQGYDWYIPMTCFSPEAVKREYSKFVGRFAG